MTFEDEVLRLTIKGNTKFKTKKELENLIDAIDDRRYR